MFLILIKYHGVHSGFHFDDLQPLNSEKPRFHHSASIYSLVLLQYKIVLSP